MRTLLFSLFICFTSISFGQEFSFGWRQRNNKSAEYTEYQSVIVQDTIYTLGGFGNPASSVDVDPGTTSFFVSAQAGYETTYLITKTLLDGTFVEAKKLIQSVTSMPTPVFHVTNQGTIILSGSAYINFNTNVLVDFDPSPSYVGSNSVDSSGNITRTYVAFYNLNGEYQNHLEYEGAGTFISGESFISFSDMSSTAQNELFLYGDFHGTIDTDFTSGTDSITSMDSSMYGADQVVVKIDLTNYDFLWSKSFGGTGISRSKFIRSNDQYIVLAGGFNDTDFDLDPSGNSAIQTNPSGLSSTFVSMLNAGTGDFVSGFSLVGTPNSVPNSQPAGSGCGAIGLAIDEESNVILHCFTNANQYIPLDIDPTSDTEILAYYGSGNSFLAKYDAADHHLHWATKMYSYYGGFESAYFGSSIDLNGSVISMGLKLKGLTLTGSANTPDTLETERGIFTGVYNSGTGILADHHLLSIEQTDANLKLTGITLDRFNSVYLNLLYQKVVDFNQFNTTFEPDSSNYYYYAPGQISYNYSPALLKLNWEGDLGMNELASANELQIYPNPALSSVIIKAESNILSYRIYASNGRLIKEVNDLNSLQVTEQLEAVSTGIYLINVETQNGSATSRIVKQ